jgi:hypothetical protein
MRMDMMMSSLAFWRVNVIGNIELIRVGLRQTSLAKPTFRFGLDLAPARFQREQRPGAHGRGPVPLPWRV